MARATKQWIVLLALLAGSSFAAADEPSPEGHWKGTVELPGQSLEILVRIVAGQGGVWSGTVDIPAQGARSLTLSKFGVSPRAVQFSIAGVPGDPTFRGTLSSSTIVGQLTQGGQTFAFQLERSSAEAIDWSARMKARAAGEAKTGTQKDEHETDDRKKGTKPAHALDEYAGEYAHPAYGVIAVSGDGASGLKATLQGIRMRLEHWHYETFRVRFEDPELADEKLFVLFRTNMKGDIDALEIPLEPETHEVVFEKKGRP